MGERLEEEPTAASQDSSVVPSVAPEGRKFEYRTEVLSSEQVADGETLPDLLNRLSSEEWDLVEIVPAEGRHVVLLRKLQRSDRSTRPVGFTIHH